MMSIKYRVGGLAAVAIIVLLAGCSAGGGDESGGDSAAAGADSSAAFGGTSGEAAGDPAGQSAGDSATGSGVAPGAASGAALTRGAVQKGAEVPAAAGSDGSALPSGADVVRTAGQTVRVDDVRAAAARARTAATALGGYVASENIYLGEPGGEPKPVDTGAAGDGVSKSAGTGATSTLTLRVPQKSTDTALDRLAGLGTELNRTSTADDVTAQVADLDSRVKSKDASVKRVRALLDRAESLKDVVLLESELSRREEELEAGQARSRALHDQAALATINLELVSKDSPPPVEGGEDDGFLSGLSDGWDALGRSTVAVLTGVGAVLPFAVLLGVIAIPGLALWRRRSAGPSTAPAPVLPPAPAPASAPAQPVGPDQP